MPNLDESVIRSVLGGLEAVRKISLVIIYCEVGFVQFVFTSKPFLYVCFSFFPTFSMSVLLYSSMFACA